MAATPVRKPCNPIIDIETDVIHGDTDRRPKPRKRVPIGAGVPIPVPAVPRIAPVAGAGGAPPVLPPMPVAAPAGPYDFWALIKVLYWNSRDEGKNHPKPLFTHGWTPQVIPRVKADAKNYADALLAKPELQKILASNPSYAMPGMKELLAWHIVAKGKETYDATMASADIAVAYMGEEADFEAFLS